MRLEDSAAVLRAGVALATAAGLHGGEQEAEEAEDAMKHMILLGEPLVATLLPAPGQGTRR